MLEVYATHTKWIVSAHLFEATDPECGWIRMFNSVTTKLFPIKATHFHIFFSVVESQEALL